MLSALFAHDGAGLAAVLAVVNSAIDVRLSLGLYGAPPHQLPEGPSNLPARGGHSTAMNAYAG